MYWHSLYNPGTVNKNIIIIIQKLFLSFLEFVTFLLPGTIWFYYDYSYEVNCGSPVDDHLPLMVKLYFAISIIVFCFVLNSLLNGYGCREFNACILGLYLLSKISLSITMLVYIQKDYKGNWDDNICTNLEPLTLYWLIWNYISVSITGIFTLIYFIFPICDF